MQSGHIWTGLRVYDGGNANYQWLDGTLMTDSSLWQPGEPNHGEHDCGYVPAHLDLIHDGSCTLTLSYICEVAPGKLEILYVYV